METTMAVTRITLGWRDGHSSSSSISHHSRSTGARSSSGWRFARGDVADDRGKADGEVRLWGYRQVTLHQDEATPRSGDAGNGVCTYPVGHDHSP